MTTIIEKDSRSIWHPFRQEKIGLPLLSIVKAKGAYLYEESGKQYLDLVSSWWVITHGHTHPKIANAIFTQAHTLEQALFADVTHPTAENLATELLKILPDHLSRIFFSDNGSTAVEVALKISHQYWYNNDQPHRRRFMAFDGGYHGDTFGAMAVGKTSGFYKPFESFLFAVDTMPYPETWDGEDNIQEKEEKAFDKITAHLEQHGYETAAFIMEPLIQGASGMRMCRPEFIEKVVKLVKAYDVLVIFDEVMTGFGRTGAMFACEKTNSKPDFICLSKGLTGGFLPLAVTVVTNKIYEAFLGETFDKAFIHGHSFAANPLGCAAALANIELFREEETMIKIKNLEEAHHHGIKKIKNLPMVFKTRVMGTVAAFELKADSTYPPLKLKQIFFERGLFLRPLGNVVYILPPYCITPEELINTYEEIKQILIL
jgi:adenosylmethionine-8-amino-7-oxononanoate aminotransferase